VIIQGSHEAALFLGGSQRIATATKRLTPVLMLFFASACSDKHPPLAGPPPGEPAPTVEAEVPATPAGGCGRPPSAEGTDLSWVRSAAKLYRLDSDGKFFVGGFDGRPWKELAHHSVETLSGASLWQSDDRRWIAYNAEASGFDQELWLFDTRAQSERRVAITPKVFTSSPEFSPDGLTLAYFASYDDRWTSKQGMGLYVVDTQSGRKIFAGYPADSKIDPLNGFGSPEWSADGSAVLVGIVGHPNDVLTREFHRFDMTARVFRRIDGKYDQEVRGSYVFIDGGKQVALHTPRRRSTDAWYGNLTSASGAWRAYVDDKQRLLVRHAKEPELLVVAGRYDACAGVTVGITGWLDDDKYLVYRNESRQFIFDPVTQRRALLLEDLPGTYTW